MPGSVDRRVVLVALGGAAIAGALPGAARATPESMAEAIRRLIGSAATKPGRIELTIPTVADNGNSISVTLKVASAMNEADRVKAVHLLNDGNPWPDVFTYRFGPRAGKAEIATRIRLARTQNVVALAEMADGTVWSAKADVTVAFGACAEEI